MKKQLFILFFLLGLGSFAQELSCKVTINTQRVNQTNQRVFTTLERSLQEYINRKAWTELKVKENERIDCSLVFTVSSYGIWEHLPNPTDELSGEGGEFFLFGK